VLPGAVLGPGDHSNFSVIFELLSRGLPAPLGDARYVVVGVDDCALGHVLALEKGKAGASYLLTNERLSLRELHQRAVEVSGVKGSVLHLPDWLLRVNSAVLSLLERFGSLPSVMSSDGARGVMSTVTFLFDSSWTQRELGWTPAPIDGTLREIMAYELGKRGKRLPALLQGVNPRV
jgi:dihydroflavonol-4-reductase